MSSAAPSLRRSNTLAVWVAAVISLYILSIPLAEACFRFDRNYNEGWNVYNAATIAHHQLLYPLQYGWTAVNYPMLSFVFLGHLHALTHDYLFTGRILSLLGFLASMLLVYACLRTLHSSWQSAALGALFCVPLFCTVLSRYIALDDPQMLAQAFFLLGLWLFLRDRTSLPNLALVAFVFVCAGCIKQSPIDFPLAVLIELCLVSFRRALWFCLCGIAFGALAVLLHLHFGGPYFLSQLLAPRVFSVHRMLSLDWGFLRPIKLPALLALYLAFIFRRDPTRRVLAILLVVSLLVGSYFIGAHGVGYNAFFTTLLAIAMLLGLFWDESAEPLWLWARPVRKSWTAIALFLLALQPLLASTHWNLAANLREDRAAQQNFDAAVTLLRAHPGPALCENLLECSFADKPYLYDPFNASRFIRTGKLSPAPIVEDLKHHRYAAVQLTFPVDDLLAHDDLVEPVILQAIAKNYSLAFTNQGNSIYLPRN